MGISQKVEMETKQKWMTEKNFGTYGGQVKNVSKNMKHYRN